MKRTIFPRTRVFLICAVCLVAIGMLGCCDCECSSGGNIAEADHWLVIHDKLTTSGTPWSACVSPSTTDDIAYLPNCLDVNKGDTVGIANYSNEDLIIKHASSLDAPNPISIPTRQAMVFTVIVEGERVLLEIVGDASHGGPGMIVRP